MAALAPRRGLWLKAAGGVVVLLAGSLLGARAWLLRDPEPHFQARYRGMATAEVQPPRRVGEMIEQDVIVRDSSGLAVEFRMRRRADAPAGSMPGAPAPLFVLLGGHMSGKESASLIEDPRHFVVASISYPFDGDERVTGLAVVGEVPAIRRAILDTPPAIMLALDYLLGRPDVDTARVELVGASFGVPFVAVAGALDRRVRRVWLVQGGADPYLMMLAGLREEIAFVPARKFVASLADLLASGPRFDPARWVPRISPRPVMMVNTLDDERIPRASADALHAAARDPKEVIWLPGLHVQPNRPDVLRSLVDAVFNRME